MNKTAVEREVAQRFSIENFASLKFEDMEQSGKSFILGQH